MPFLLQPSLARRRALPRGAVTVESRSAAHAQFERQFSENPDRGFAEDPASCGSCDE